MTNLVRRSETGTVNYSRALVSVAKESGAAQLTCSIIISRHGLFVIPVDLKYSPSRFFSFFVDVLDRVNCSLMSGYRMITMSSAEFAWRTELRPGVSFDYAFMVLLGTDERFLDSVEFTSSANNLSVVLATFMAQVRSSATDRIEDAVSREYSEMLGSKNMNIILTL